MAHKPLNTFHLFSGAGGGILADLLLGHNPIGAAEIEKYPREVLLARQRDGHLPNFPVWDDVSTLSGLPWRGSVDILCGGFPCQDISAAGKGAGITGERSGLWKEYARLIGEMQPKFVFAENSPLLRTRGLGVVLEDLAALGYNARWGVLGARDVGAPHKRDRMWVLAYTSVHGHAAAEESNGTPQRGNTGKTRQEPTSKSTGLCASRTDSYLERKPENVAYTDVSGNGTPRCSADGYGSETVEGRQIEPQSKSGGLGDALAYTDEQRAQISTDGRHSAEQMPWSDSSQGSSFWHTDPAEVDDSPSKGLERPKRSSVQRDCERLTFTNSNAIQGTTEPLVGRVAHGVADRVDRLKALGNGQVPSCAAVAFDILAEGLI